MSSDSGSGWQQGVDANPVTGYVGLELSSRLYQQAQSVIKCLIIRTPALHEQAQVPEYSSVINRNVVKMQKVRVSL
jgi:hypothetical protein